MGIYGADWSSYQSATPDTTGLSFAFVKVTEGLSYVNPLWARQRDHAKANGLAVGFYHYPHIANGPTTEADYFLAQINLAAGDILCLDWEWYGQTVTDAQARAYKKAFLDRLTQKAPGHRRVLYVDRNNWLNVDTDGYCGDGLWIADYVTAGAPRVQHPWVFHQYTSSPVDKDVANFPSVQALRDWATGAQPTPTPTPPPTPPPTPTFLEDDMLAYLPPIEAGATVDVPVEPAGTLTAPQGGANNGPLWVVFLPQGQGGTISVATWSSGKLGTATPYTLTVGAKQVVALPTDGTVQAVRVTTNVPLVGYVTGRTVA